MCFERNPVRAIHIPARETRGLGKRPIRRRYTNGQELRTILVDSLRGQNSLGPRVIADGGQST